MKIRNGFVSNSSSSSFVVMTTMENHEKAMKKLHPYIQDVVNEVIGKTKFMGRECVYFGELSIQDYSGVWEDFDNTLDGKWGSEDELEEGELIRPKGQWDNEMRGREAVELWQKAINECPEAVFNWGEDG